MDPRIQQAEVVKYDPLHHLMSERFAIDKGGQRLLSLDRVRIRCRRAWGLSSRFALDKDVSSATSPLVPEFAFDGCRGLGWKWTRGWGGVRMTAGERGERADAVGDVHTGGVGGV